MHVILPKGSASFTNFKVAEMNKNYSITKY